MFHRKKIVITCRRLNTKEICWFVICRLYIKLFVCSSVADPDPPDPHVFGPPGSGSGSISQKYGSRSGSGFFYHHAKIVRKTLFSTALWLLFDFLSLKMLYMYLQKVISIKNFLTNISFFVGILKFNDKNSRILIRTVREMDPRIQIRIQIKMSWIRKTGLQY